MRINWRHEAGDTIVEVLLAIGIIALVLSGAYAATNRSLQASQSAQERTVALKIAETQLERLKYSKDSQTWVEPADAFCIKADGTSVQPVADLVGEPNCIFNDRYRVSIKKDTNSVYKIRLLWLKATSSSSAIVDGKIYEGYDQLELFYRISDDRTVGAASPAPTPTPPTGGEESDDEEDEPIEGCSLSGNCGFWDTWCLYNPWDCE